MHVWGWLLAQLWQWLTSLAPREMPVHTSCFQRLITAKARVPASSQKGKEATKRPQAPKGPEVRDHRRQPGEELRFASFH